MRTVRSVRSKPEKGFSLIEVMFSIVLMTVGLVSLLGVFGLAMASTQTSMQNSISKQIANEAMEGILTARETQNLTWGQIANTGAGGIFLSGLLPVDCAGLDGIIGTADDAACGPQILNLPAGRNLRNCRRRTTAADQLSASDCHSAGARSERQPI